MWAASFKSLYQKRPVWEHAAAQGCVAGRSRYSTKTSRYKSGVGECIWQSALIEIAEASIAVGALSPSLRKTRSTASLRVGYRLNA